MKYKRLTKMVIVDGKQIKEDTYYTLKYGEIVEGEDDNAYILPNIPSTVKQLYNSEEVEKIAKEREEYKHRAEIAEKALCNALNDDSCYFCNKKSPCECEHRDWGSKECITVLLRQAEKELAEEEKNVEI